MEDRPELYFPEDTVWRKWLEANHKNYPQGVYLIFHKVELDIHSMRWEEAVKVALCYGWIDSTVKSLGNGKRRQYFCPRNPKSSWSALNKKYISELEEEGLVHKSGWKTIEIAKENGKWTEMDHVENLIIPEDLQKAFQKNDIAFTNYESFAPSYQKSYLSWLHSAKRDSTRKKRIQEIINFCEKNMKSRQ